MSEKYVSVDAGKGDTKVSVYQEGQPIKTYLYNTKYSEGDFCDDALEKNTFIAEIDGKTYKVGNGALQSAELEVTKKSEIHKISTLLALAMVAEPDEIDEFHVVIGCPLSEYAVPSIRMDYMNYMLPDGEVTVKIKRKSDLAPEIKTFCIKSKKVLPETAGVFFLSLNEKYDGEPVGIIDIGNGTAIGAVYSDYAIDHEFDFTNMQGGDILVSSLSELLSTKYSRYNSKYTLKLLLKPTAERKLAGRSDLSEEEQKKNEEESAKLIHDHIVKHLREIRRSCDAKQWSIDYMSLIFAGGTSFMLKKEVKEVFGDNVTFAKYGVHSNCLGFLLRLVQLKEKKLIDLSNITESNQ